jgi:hypothetical protein
VKTLLFALGTLTLVGCSGLKPIGPFAPKVPLTQQGKPIPGVTAESTARAAKPPMLCPTPPTLYVTPSDVNSDNPYTAANKLTSELAADGKMTQSAPVTAEVSHIQGRIR